MSTAHEAIVAAYCGMKVFALSVITDAAACVYDSVEESNHEEILQVAKKRTDDVVGLVTKFIQKIKENKDLLE
jgi:purine-nucleoside phosphorylase